MSPDSYESAPSQPGPDDEAAKRQTGNRECHRNREERRQTEIESSEITAARYQSEPQALADVIDGHQRERAETPKDKSMSQPRQRALPDHHPLQQNFPNEFVNARAKRTNGKGGVLFSRQDLVNHLAKAHPEQVTGRDGQYQEQHFFRPGQGHRCKQATNVSRYDEGCG